MMGVNTNTIFVKNIVMMSIKSTNEHRLGLRDLASRNLFYSFICMGTHKNIY